MNKSKIKKPAWADWLVTGYLVIVVGVGIGVGGYYLSQVSSVFADPPEGGAGNTVANNTVANNTTGGTSSGGSSAADSTTSYTFEEYFCDVVAPIGGDIVITLTVLMLLAAGVTYILSMGQSSGDVGGISTAKAMITAAVTGLLLYAMGTLLLGQCGFTMGGWIFKLFGAKSGGGPTVNTEVNPSTGGSPSVDMGGYSGTV